MARRTSKAEAKLIVFLLIVGAPIYVVSRIYEATGWVVPAILVAVIILISILYRYDKKQKRLAYLRGKYPEDIVQKILGGFFWQGQTEEQLEDALGRPAAVDHKLLKTIRREVWKYHQQGKNRYQLRITVENGHVSGWDQKQ